MNQLPRRSRQGGTSLIEVLVTLVILALGLLGLVGLQTRLQVSEMESYQRAQALILLNDMASRLAANRTNADAYITTTPLGVGFNCASIGSSDRQTADSTEWCLALQGAAERTGTSNIGAMVGGRGCVGGTGTTGEYLITVAWQGLAPLSAPPEGVPCGSGLYNNGTTCTNDLCRRVVTTLVRIATL